MPEADRISFIYQLMVSGTRFNAGYNFWLNKLNSFNGNFIQAEMVKAFLLSAEYRQRFGP